MIAKDGCKIRCECWSVYIAKNNCKKRKEKVLNVKTHVHDFEKFVELEKKGGDFVKGNPH